MRKTQRRHLFLNSSDSSSLSKHAAYITQNATQPLSDVTGGNLSDYMLLPLEPQTDLYYFFSPTYTVVLIKTCECVKLLELPFKFLLLSLL